MVSNLVFLDHRLVPPVQARLSPFNTAFLFGECLLEAVPVYGGFPLFLEDHLDRLEKGCRFLGWSLPPRSRFQQAIRLFTAHSRTPDRFVIRFGLVQEVEPPAAPRHFSAKKPRLLAMIRPLRHQPLDFWPSSGKAGVSPWVVSDPEMAPGQFKWIFYMMIRRDFRQHPDWDEMLRLNRKGFVVDGGSAAPLWFADGTVHASSLRKGGLESVTRRKILNLCRSLGIRLTDKPWKPADALKRGELFFVGSGVGVLGISHLQGKALQRSTPLTLRLWQHYRDWTLQKGGF